MPPPKSPPTPTATPTPHRNPYLTLLTTFTAWKAFLLLLTLGSILAGDAYDTSAGLVVQGRPGTGTDSGIGSSSHGGGSPSWATTLATRLTSWDAIYFVSSARRGYRFEQEWAFGAGLPGVVRGVLGGEFFFGFLVFGWCDVMWCGVV
jgi:phosphatidylinositol glycan class V